MVIPCQIGYAQERVCETPDCVVVSNVHSEKGRVTSIGVLDTRLHFFVYVPPTTTGFTLGIFDQTDEVVAGKPSLFVLYAPDGSEQRTLDQPLAKAWANYAITTNGQWGIWRLSITGPEDGNEGAEKTAKAENAFLVRTTGSVDLYLKPNAAARVRGVRFGSPRFNESSLTHRFTLQVPNGVQSLRLNLLHPQTLSRETVKIKRDNASAAFTQQRNSLDGDDRLAKNVAFSTLDLGGSDLGGLWNLTMPTVAEKGVYGVGTDGSTRIFFLPQGAKPLMPLPVSTSITTKGGAAVVTVTSPQTACEPLTVESDAQGRADLPLLPGVRAYRVNVTRGFAFTPAEVNAVPGKEVSVELTRRLVPMPGWYGGDTHCHTSYYDGSDTPAQMVAAARANGLDWLVMTEHAHSEYLGRPQRATKEALAAAGKTLMVVPGMEYTGPNFHANIWGGTVSRPTGASLADLLTAAKTGSRDDAPLTVALNHPTIGKTAAGIARENAGVLPLMELWNSSEPEATRLWWDLLNDGHRIFAETGSDSHERRGAPLGFRRTYAYLGNAPLTAANIVRAVRDGHSYLSRGALLDAAIGGARPGGNVAAGSGASVPVRVKVQSITPIRRVEVICNGQVVHSWQGNDSTEPLTLTADLPAAPGWYLIQVWGAETAGENKPLPLAMSNPVWVTEKGKKQ